MHAIGLRLGRPAELAYSTLIDSDTNMYVRIGMATVRSLFSWTLILAERPVWDPPDRTIRSVRGIDQNERFRSMRETHSPNASLPSPPTGPAVRALALEVGEQTKQHHYLLPGVARRTPAQIRWRAVAPYASSSVTMSAAAHPLRPPRLEEPCIGSQFYIHTTSLRIYHLSNRRT